MNRVLRNIGWLILVILACDSVTPVQPEHSLLKSSGPVLVQKVQKPAVTITPWADFPNTPQAGNRLVAVIGMLHDSIVTVTPGWTNRVAPTTFGHLYVYEQIADGEPAGIAFTIRSRDATTLALFEFAVEGTDSQAQNAAGPRLADAVTTLSTGTAQNTTGTLALAVIYRPDTKAETSESIDGWTNGFKEELDFMCCGPINRSRLAIATRELSGSGSVETSASWTTPRRASGAVVTYK